MDRRLALGLLLGTIGVTIFGATVPFTRFALAWFDPWFLSFGRAALGGLAALALVLILRRPFPFSRPATLRDLAFSSLCLVFGYPLLMASASQTVPAAHAGVVLGLLPLATTLAGTIFNAERPSLALVGASAVGALLVAAFALRNGGAAEFGSGDLLLLLAILVCAVGYALSTRLSQMMRGWEVIAFMLVLCLPVTLPAAILTLPAHAGEVPAHYWAAFIYLGLMSQFIGFFFWNAGLAMGGISRVAQVQLLQTFVTVGLAWPINGERPDLETLAFAVAVVAVVAFAQRYGRVRVAPPRDGG